MLGDLPHFKDLSTRTLDSNMQVLKVMGCIDPALSNDLSVASGSLAACMIAAGVRPRQDPFLMALVQAYRRSALKDVLVRHWALLLLLLPP
jgi:hypothetical protein